MGICRSNFHARALACAIALAAFVALSVVSGSPAATSSTVVGATVPSATSLDAAGCPPRTSGVTSFGTVLPGGSFVTAAPCVVTFGSSNDTANLRVMQGDLRGAGMHRTLEPTIDTGFGSGGIGVTDVEPGLDDAPSGGWTDPTTGNLYIAGTVGVAPNRDAAVVRFLPDGTPDAAFGPSGIRTYDLGGDEVAEQVASIETTGEMALLGWASADGFMLRLDLDGNPVTTWESAGVLTIDMSPWNGAASSLVRASDGGYFLAAGGKLGSRIRKLDDSLAPMTSWGSGGELAIPGYECKIIHARSDGGLLCSGFQELAPGDQRAVIGRATSSGTLDTTFGGDGVVEFDPGDPGFMDAVFNTTEANGYVYGSGIAVVGGAPNALIVRLLSNGTPDPSFGPGGMFTYSLPGMVGVGGGQIEVLDQQGSLRVAGMAIDPVDGFGVHVGRLSPQLTWVPGATGSATGYTVVTLDAPGIDTMGIHGGYIEVDGDYVLTVAVDNGGGDLDSGVFRLTAGAPLPDYAAGVNDWNDGTSFFGVCAAQVVGAVAVADWTTGACTAADGAHWRALPTGGAPAIAAHTTGPTAVDAQLDLHFGLRLAANTAPGDYEAPIRFEVVAPDA